MTEYVLGFLFHTRKNYVALIEKSHPEWQKGKLNGIGGKIQEKESPLAAMCREFKEEAGVFIPSWDHFATMSGPAWTVYCFKAFADCKIQTMEDEKVDWYPVQDILETSTIINNLKWLIPMAQSKDKHFAFIKYSPDKYPSIDKISDV